MSRLWSTISILIMAALLGVMLVMVSTWLVTRGNVIYTTAEQVPHEAVGIVFGCSKYIQQGPYQGYANTYYQHRIQAAYTLYKTGKVTHLLLSGDNGSKSYSEPDDMRHDLLALGIPAEAITLDYAGFRTLDTLVRAKEIFGITRAVLVSQSYHLHRALFIAKHKGIEAVGYSATQPYLSRRLYVKNMGREWLARTWTLLDLYLLRTAPRYLGQPEPIAIQ